MRQLLPDLLPDSPPSLDNFVAGGNAAALATFTDWLAGLDGTPSLHLWGEAGAGKSHLLVASGFAQIDAAADPTLAGFIEGINVVDGDRFVAGDVGATGQRRVGGGVDQDESAGDQQVALAGAGLAPQVQRRRAVEAGQPVGESGQRRGIVAGDEIVERRRVGGQQVEQELAHGEHRPALIASGSSRTASCRGAGW